MTINKNGAGCADKPCKAVESFGRGQGSVPVGIREQLVKYIEMSVKVVGLNPDLIDAFRDNKTVLPFKYLRKKFGDVRSLLDANSLLKREGYPDLMDKSVKLRRLVFVK